MPHGEEDIQMLHGHGQVLLLVRDGIPHGEGQTMEKDAAIA